MSGQVRNGAAVDPGQRTAIIRQLRSEGKTAHEIADHLGLKLCGLRKWLRIHGHRDLLDELALVRMPDMERRRANAARASRAASALARVKRGADSREVSALVDAVWLLGGGESAAQVARRLGIAAGTLERYASEVARSGVLDDPAVVELGLDVDTCVELQRVFGSEHASEVTYRRERRLALSRSA